MKLGWLLLALSCASCSRGFVVHVGEDAPSGTVIASAHGSASASCALEQVLSPKFTRNFLRVDPAAGTVSTSDRLRCRSLLSNPFVMHTVADCTSTSSSTVHGVPGVQLKHLVLGQYLVHVWGSSCGCKPRRREKWDVEVISLLQVPECLEVGTALLQPQDVLPGTGAGAGTGGGGLACNVTGSSELLSFVEGQLVVPKQLCFQDESLLEFDLHCTVKTARSSARSSARSMHVHWHLGHGPFKQRYLEKLLWRAAQQSDSGLLSLSRRSRRSPNTQPQFQPPMYQVSIPENKPAGTSVVILRAVDLDEGEAGRLDYFIEALFDSRSNNLFSVDTESGLVSTVEELDRETKDTHVFKVTAVDHGTPRRTAMATLIVTVSDMNDHDPVFKQQDYKESVRENLEIGYEVLTVRATDGDAPVNGNILYHILNSNGSNDVFEIDSRSGVIRTRGPVDRETVESYMLLVEANDQGRDPAPRSATATVHIVVEDDNDNARSSAKNATLCKFQRI